MQACQETKKNKVAFALLSFCNKNVVMLIALLAASITTFFVPIDKEYLNYFDFIFIFYIIQNKYNLYLTDYLPKL